jgi:NAD+ kinase
MKHFYIVTKDDSKDNLDLIMRMRSYLTERAAKCSYGVLRQEEAPLEYPEGIDVILTVGGDGTLIRAADQSMGSHAPLIGINRGHLGYLCDLDESNLEESLQVLLDGSYELEERMLLTGRVYNKDGNAKGDYQVALNDVVISSYNGLQVMHMVVYVNGEMLYSFNGDGMIFATPTGSTAYNLSAGGPIVDPKTQLILMTPLNAHVVGSRSIILDAEDEIAVEMIPRREDEKKAAVSFDGSTYVQLEVGDRVYVKKSPEVIRFIKLSRMNFLDRIRSKLQAD